MLLCNAEQSGQLLPGRNIWVNVVSRKGNAGQLEHFAARMERPLISVILQYNERQELRREAEDY